jgi:hypothetical protein
VVYLLFVYKSRTGVKGLTYVRLTATAASDSMWEHL